MGTPTPPFQATPLAASAAANHEFFATYVNAGFSEQQAMQILLVVIWFGLMSSQAK